MSRKRKFNTNIEILFILNDDYANVDEVPKLDILSAIMKDSRNKILITLRNAGFDVPSAKLENLNVAELRKKLRKKYPKFFYIENSDCDSFEDSFLEFAEKRKESSVTIVFYLGHGITQSDVGMAFVLPKENKDGTTFCVTLSEMDKVFKKTGGSVFYFLVCCSALSKITPCKFDVSIKNEEKKSYFRGVSCASNVFFKDGKLGKHDEINEISYVSKFCSLLENWIMENKSISNFIFELNEKTKGKIILESHSNDCFWNVDKEVDKQLRLIKRFNDYIFEENEIFKTNLNLFIPLTGSEKIGEVNDRRKGVDCDIVIERFLNNKKKVLLLLGDSGSGKSTLGQYIFCKLASISFLKKERFPIFIPLHEISNIKEIRMNKLKVILKNKIGISDEEYKEVIKLPLLIILDGYDELGEKFINEGTNFYKILKLFQIKDVKVVFSCRTQILNHMNKKGGSYFSPFIPYNNKGSGSVEDIDVFVLQSFSPDQMKEYIIKFVDSHYIEMSKRKKKKEEFTNFLKKTKFSKPIDNPFLLNMVLKSEKFFLKVRKDLKRDLNSEITRFEIYLAYVLFFRNERNRLSDKNLIDNEKIKDELDDESQVGMWKLAHLLSFRFFLKKHKLKLYIKNWKEFVKFKKKLEKKDIHGIDNMLVNYKKFEEENDKEEKKKENFNNFSMKRVLDVLKMEEDSEKKGKKENFDSYEEEGEGEEDSDNEEENLPKNLLQCLPLTRINKDNPQIQFVHTSIMEFFVSSFFLNWLTIKKKSKDLKLLFQVKNFNFEKNVISFLADIIRERMDFQEKLMQIILDTRKKKGVSDGIAAANAITILNSFGFSFSGMDLSGIKIPNADLTNSIMHNTILSGSDLTNVIFHFSYLIRCKMDNCIMKNVSFFRGKTLRINAYISDCSVSPCDKFLLLFHFGGTISIWNVYNISNKNKNELLFKSKILDFQNKRSVNLIPFGISEVFDWCLIEEYSILSFISKEGNVYLWKKENGKIELNQNFNLEAICVKFFSKNNVIFLAVSYENGKIVIYKNIPLKNEVYCVFFENENIKSIEKWNFLSWNPSGSILASLRGFGKKEKCLNFWNIKEKKISSNVKFIPKGLNKSNDKDDCECCVSWHPKGSYLFISWCVLKEKGKHLSTIIVVNDKSSVFYINVNSYIKKFLCHPKKDLLAFFGDKSYFISFINEEFKIVGEDKLNKLINIDDCYWDSNGRFCSLHSNGIVRRWSFDDVIETKMNFEEFKVFSNVTSWINCNKNTGKCRIIHYINNSFFEGIEIINGIEEFKFEENNILEDYLFCFVHSKINCVFICYKDCFKVLNWKNNCFKITNGIMEEEVLKKFKKFSNKSENSFILNLMNIRSKSFEVCVLVENFSELIVGVYFFIITKDNNSFVMKEKKRENMFKLIIDSESDCEFDFINDVGPGEPINLLERINKTLNGNEIIFSWYHNRDNNNDNVSIAFSKIFKKENPFTVDLMKWHPYNKVLAYVYKGFIYFLNKTKKIIKDFLNIRKLFKANVEKIEWKPKVNEYVIAVLSNDGEEIHIVDCITGVVSCNFQCSYVGFMKWHFKKPLLITLDNDKNNFKVWDVGSKNFIENEIFFDSIFEVRRHDKEILSLDFFVNEKEEEFISIIFSSFGFKEIIMIFQFEAILNSSTNKYSIKLNLKYTSCNELFLENLEDVKKEEKKEKDEKKK